MLVWTGVSTDTRVLREATTLVEAGWDVHVVGRAVPPDFVPPGGISVSSLGTPPAAQTRGRDLTRLERVARWALLPEHVSRRLRRWQRDALVEGRRHRADVVHAHDFSALPVGAELAEEWQVPLVYDSHELWSGRPREGRPTPLRSRTESRREQALGARAAVVLTVGEGVAEALRREHGWRDVRVVRNTVPAPPQPPRVAAQPSAALYAGRIAAYRELEVLARASGRAPLPIAMMGPTDEHFLARFDAGAAELRPGLPPDEVDQALSAAGLALVTHSDRWANHRLALPNKLFHAVRAGVPVVATDVGELARVVREHDLGELYRPGDADDLVRAMRRAVERYPQLRANVAQAATVLTWAADAATLTSVYEAFGASQPPGILGRQPGRSKEVS
ncbi:MAG TPA: glycosyltransferase [Angustibacter sp.]|nr:glycosyltransferase [Angustibacter sp.]